MTFYVNTFNDPTNCANSNYSKCIYGYVVNYTLIDEDGTTEVQGYGND